MQNITGKQQTAVSLGIFDGVHIGHRAVLSEAGKSGLETAVFTFSSETVTTKGNRGVIYPNDRKLKMLRSLGAKYILSPDFSSLCEMSAEDFVKEVLASALSAKEVYCGEDFRFGKGAAAGVKELENLCDKYDMKLKTLPPVMFDGTAVSSTRIKDALESGDIQAANAMLGEDFGYYERVIHGNELGRTLDFPTINQPIPPDTVLPRFGVYLTEVKLDGKLYNGVSNVGVKPTVGKNKPLIETHILGLDKTLYGEWVSVRLKRFIREEKRFASLDELKAQVDLDIENAERNALR
ncbi:MAG: bifunctional riboflavin kinase/FAD synthetase [Ruminococcus sp.]|nr:bifunctional riboflavin kinase/FAD synthetase [Ruminococcus sp.]